MSNYPFNPYGGTQWYYYPNTTTTTDTITITPNTATGGYYYVPVQAPVMQPIAPLPIPFTPPPAPAPVPLSIPDTVTIQDLQATHGIKVKDEAPKQTQIDEAKKFADDLIAEFSKKKELGQTASLQEIDIKVDGETIGTVSVAEKLINEPTPGIPKYEQEVKISDIHKTIGLEELDGPQMFVKDGYTGPTSVSIDGYLSLAKTSPKIGQRWLFENNSYKIVFEVDKVNTQTVTVVALQSIRNTKPQYASYENGKQIVVPHGAFATSDWTYLEGQDRPNA